MAPPRDGRGFPNRHLCSRWTPLGLLKRTRNIEFVQVPLLSWCMVYPHLRHITPPHRIRVQVRLRYRTPQSALTLFPVSVCYQDFHECPTLELLSSPGLSCPYMRLYLGPSSRLEEARVIPVFQNSKPETPLQVVGFP